MQISIHDVMALEMKMANPIPQFTHLISTLPLDTPAWLTSILSNQEYATGLTWEKSRRRVLTLLERSGGLQDNRSLLQVALTPRMHFLVWLKKEWRTLLLFSGDTSSLTSVALSHILFDRLKECTS